MGPFKLLPKQNSQLFNAALNERSRLKNDTINEQKSPLKKSPLKNPPHNTNTVIVQKLSQIKKNPKKPIE